jgi:hypothetical protein
MHFSSTIVISVPLEKIWNILSQVSNYPQWQSGVTKVEGTASLGSKIRLYSEVSPGRAFPLTVTSFEPTTKMTFVGGMPLGLFTGTRTYLLTATQGGIRFDMDEIYTGPLAPLFTKSIPDLNPSFQKFANGLKLEAEKI